MSYYTHQFRGYQFLSCVVGSTHPRWARESFGLENAVRENWFDVRPGDVVIDAGAGFGNYTLPALAAGAGLVIAAEPDKETFFCLSNNVAINRYHPSRFFLLPAILCDQDFIVMGFDSNKHVPLHETGNSLDHRVGRSIDGLCESCSLTRLDWIKIDVDGAESYVVLGTLESLKKFGPKVIIENHVGINPSVKSVIDVLMQRVDYRLLDEAKGTGINDDWTLWGPSKSEEQKGTTP